MKKRISDLLDGYEDGSVELSGGTPACQPEEVAGIRFLPFEDALAALTHPSDRDTLQKAQTFLKDR